MTKIRDRNERRPAAPLNTKLDRSLATYVAAAGAAGVAILAAAQPAEAKVVYNAANTQLFFGYYGTQPLDLNNDGIADITFSGGSQVGYGTSLRVYAAAGNAVVGAKNLASALIWGARVGPKDVLSSQHAVMAVRDGCHSSTCFYTGPWIKTHNRYLGVKFSAHGQTHYGWVSVNVGTYPRLAVLTGYAYETLPDKPILAGQKSGPVVASVVDAEEMLAPARQPATLGLLARGADAIAVWRRDEEDEEIVTR
jgi:hypothetical protein